MKIGMVMLTFNRLEYTKIVLENYFKTTKVPHQLHIWDNHSTDGTEEWLIKTAKKKYPITIILNQRNIGPQRAIQEYFKLSKDRDLVGKIDNDVLMSNRWLENFVKAFKRVPELAIAGAYNKLNPPKSFRNYHGLLLAPTKSGMQESLWLARRSIVDRIPFVENGYAGNWNWFSRLGKQVLIAYRKNVYYLTDNRQWGGTSPFPDVNYDAYYAKIRKFRGGKLPR